MLNPPQFTAVKAFEPKLCAAAVATVICVVALPPLGLEPLILDTVKEDILAIVVKLDTLVMESCIISCLPETIPAGNMPFAVTLFPAITPFANTPP